MKIKAQKNGTQYDLPDSSVIRRSNRHTPNGNALHGRWALIDKSGFIVDFDQYINDLAERNNIELYT